MIHIILYILLGLVSAFVLLVIISLIDDKISERRVLKKMYSGEKDINDSSKFKPSAACVEKLVFKKSDLPFIPNSNEVIYVDCDDNSEASRYIYSHYEKIKKVLAKDHFNFLFLPKIIVELKEMDKENDVILYRNPTIVEYKLQDNPAVSTSSIFSYLPDKKEIEPGFLVFSVSNSINDSEDETYDCIYLKLNTSIDFSLEEQVNALLPLCENIRRSSYVLYNIGQPPEDEKAEAGFSYEATQLIDEIKERVEKLHKMGFEGLLIDKLCKIDEKISRLVITQNYRIMLPDYNDMEIEMTPLPKAVFFLFLRHPEGIAFKSLCDYRKELLSIYNKITNRSSQNDILRSIANITDPTNNSINEKCARIREAFVSKFDERLAHNYFITGRWGKPKKIILSKELIIWECDMP